MPGLPWKEKEQKIRKPPLEIENIGSAVKFVSEACACMVMMREQKIYLHFSWHMAQFVL